MKKILNTMKIIKKEYGLTAYDIAYVISAILVSILLLVSSKYHLGNNSGRAVIKYNNREIMALNLKEDRIVILSREKYPFLLDDMHIEVRNGKIGVTKEKSPNHYCSRMGFVGESTKPIICQPNRVIILIENLKSEDREIDLEVY